MDAQITDLLDTIGVDTNTQARLALFLSVKGPGVTADTDEEMVGAFMDPAPVTVSLTAGQVMLLRGGLRWAMQGLFQAHAQKAMIDSMFGNDPSEGFLDGGPSLAYQSYLDCEDILAGAAALLAPVTVPDAMPEAWAE